MESLNSFLFVVVIYNQSLNDSPAFISLSEQLQKHGLTANLAVYDNSFEKKQVQSTKHFTIHYVHDASNPGISKSYNRASQLASDLGKEWLLFFDQDTILSSVSFNSYLKAANDLNLQLAVPSLLLADGRVFSPCKVIFKKGKMLKEVLPAGNYLFSDYSFVNSGLLIKQSLFQNAGGYNEAVKLDYADFQFIEKLRNITAGFTLLDFTLQHSFSDASDNKDNTKRRFMLFINDIKNCSRRNGWDDLLYFRIVLIRSIKLTLKFRTFFFLNKVVFDYLK